MTDSERIEVLEYQVSTLRDALVGLASGQMISINRETGNPVVTAAAGFSVSSHEGVSVDHYPSLPSPPPSHLIVSPCNSSPHQHHYRMQSGLCACQDRSWAR